VAIWFGCLAGAAAAQPTREQATARPFVIGFLNEGSDLPNAPVLMEQVRKALEANARLMQALAAAHFGELTLSPCDGPRDMAQRLAVGEFDLAFATAPIYALQRGQMTPLLQTRLPGDFMAPGRPAGVQRRGVILAGPSSPLFQLPELNSPAAREQLRAELRRGPLAVTWSEGAAGYIFPRLLLARLNGPSARPQFLFCGPDAEVIKAVVSGLVPLGACRKGEIDLLLPREERNHYVRELMETDYFPTDPVLLRNELLPIRSVAGTELKALLRGLFNLNLKLENGLRLEDAAPEDYAGLARVLAGLNQGAGPALPAEDTPGTTPLRSLPSPLPRVVTPAVVTPAATPVPTQELKPVLPPLAAGATARPGGTP
jgi:hypothetical protein